MARRKSNGGRVTPKGTRPLSLVGGSATSALPSELDDLLPRFDEETALYRDAEAASFVAMFEDSARPSNLIDLRVDEDRPTARDVLGLLASFGSRPPQRVVATVAAFAAYGGASADDAVALLDSFSLGLTEASASIGHATLMGASVIEDVFGEATQYVLDVSYPDGSRGAIALLVDTLLGGVVKDALVLDDSHVLLDMVNDTAELSRRSCDPEVAAAAIDEAYSMNDMTLGIDQLIAEDVVPMRLLVERVLAPLNRQPETQKEVTKEERDRIVGEFVAWAHEHRRDVADDVLSWTSLAIDFAVDHASGAPLKWGPSTTITFLEWATSHVMADPDEMREIPALMEVFVPWAHDKIGWGDQYITETLDAIDLSRELFEDAITGRSSGGPVSDVLREALAEVDLGDPAQVAAAIERYNESLDAAGPTLPPSGGTHPEAFDAPGLGPASERSAAIADLASVAARAIFDEEYVTLVRRLARDVALADPTLMSRGRADIWAAGLVYAIAQLNEIVGGWSQMAMAAEDLTDRLAGSPGTITSKAGSIRQAVGVDRWSSDPRYQHGGAQFDLSALEIDFGGFGGRHDADRPPPAKPSYDRLPDGSAFELRCELVHLPVWRSVIMSGSATLGELHQVIQRAFDWDDYHLHEFTIGTDRFAADDDSEWVMSGPVALDDSSIRLDEIVRPGAVFTYVYDFGDNWQMNIRVVRQLEPDRTRPKVELVDGAGDAPPEDCGGAWGYQNLIEAITDPRHPDHDDLTEWAGDFRPGSFDLAATAERVHLR